MTTHEDAIEPLGPRREAPYAAAELAAGLASEPALLGALGEPAVLAHGCRLYACGAGAGTSAGATGAGAVAAGAGASALGTAGVDASTTTCADAAAGPLMRSVCALGAFDGVHLGHRELVRATVAEARELGLPSVVVTFDPDPADVLHGPERGSTLLGVHERLRVLASLGVDALLVVPFTRETASTSHERFLTEWLVPCVGTISLHVGENFRMGAGGAGTLDALRRVAAPLGVSVHGHALVEAEGAPVSATRIRGLVRSGDVEAAACLLGRYHCVTGTVEHGRGEGTSFGFPTANVSCDATSCLPAEGVYAGLACTGGRVWPTAVNVGAPRTFGGEEGRAFLEPTLLGFSGDLYGHELSVCFVAWLREPRTFASLDELERTVLGNVAWVRRYVGAGELRLAPARG